MTAPDAVIKIRYYACRWEWRVVVDGRLAAQGDSIIRDGAIDDARDAALHLKAMAGVDGWEEIPLTDPEGGQ